MSGSMSNDMFVSCQWLKHRIANRHLFQNLVILDVSWASDKNMEDEFLREHIPGAQFFNIMDDNHTDMYPRNLPSGENFQSRARAIGINNDSHLVLYSKSQHGGLFVSGRAWWTFSYFGHQSISVLDGGFSQWLEENGDVSKERCSNCNCKIGDFSTNVRGNLRVEFDEMVQIVKTHGQIIDSRASDKLNLKDPSTYIGNAINIPMSVIVKGHLIMPKDELREFLTEKGVKLNQPTVCYCNSGMSSCSLVLAIIYCGGQARLYSGGYNEWKRKIYSVEHLPLNS